MSRPTRGSCTPAGGGGSPGAGWAAVALDGLAVGALDLAGAVGVDGQDPAEFVQDDVVVPPAVVLEISEAGAAAVFAVDHVVGFAAARGLVAAAGVLAGGVPEGDQGETGDRDVVGLADVEREGGASQGLAEQLAAQGGGGTAGAGDDLQDLGQDLVFQLGEGGGGRGGDLCGLLGAAGGGAGQPGRDRGGAGQPGGDRGGAVGVLGSGVGLGARAGRDCGAVGDGVCGAGSGVCERSGLDAEMVVFHAQGDQVLDRGRVDVTDDHRDNHRVAGDLAGRVPFQPDAAVAGGDRVGGAVGGPPGPVPGDPGVLDGGVLVHRAELGEVDVDQGLHGLPGPLGQQVRGQEAAHCLFERVMVALRAGARVIAAPGGGQGV